MELNYLREFVALAQSCQFLETADELFMSQSSLSKHIKAIEKELGHELLNRSTRRVELSEFGRAFLPYATQIASLQKDYTEHLLRHSDNRHIIIGISPIITLYTLEKYFSSFSIAHPEYSIEFVDGNEDALRGMLKKSRCDAIIVSRSMEQMDADFCSELYSTDILVAVMATGNPLASQPSVTLKELSNKPFVQMGHINFARRLDPSIPPSSYTASRGSVLLNLIRNDSAIAILPRYAAWYHIRNGIGDGISVVDLEPETKIYFDALYLKTRQNSMFIQSLTEYLMKKQERKNAYGML